MPPTSLAQAARYAAHQPFSQASAVPAGAKSRPDTAAANASASSGATAGAASAFAGTVRSGTEWNWSQSTGAVASPQAVEIENTSASFRGSG